MAQEHLVLYRKYRPRDFSEIVGQEHVVGALGNAFAMNRIAHAYLFSGPRGVGKTTIARLIAKSLNCSGEKKPCNVCAFCKDFNAGRAMDLIEIDAASNRGIDEIRELREGVRAVPVQGKFKTYVIDECLTGDHLITLADGTVKFIKDILNGNKISSVNLKTGLISEKRISNWFVRKTNVLVHIRTPQSTIKCTPTHQLWVLRSGIFQKIAAKNILKNDFLLSPVILPHVQKNTLSPDQLAFLALIQCDGHISKDSATIQVEISKDSEYFINVFTRGVKAWNCKGTFSLTQTMRGTTLLRYYSHELKKELLSLSCPAGKKGHVIDIPDRVFQAPLESIKAYIDTCFCCEGDASFSPLTNLYKLCFNSTSEIFCKKLQLLLKKFSISSSFMTIYRMNIKHHTIYRLNLTGYDLRLYQINIGLSLARKADVVHGQLRTNEKQDGIPIQVPLLEKRRELQLSKSFLYASKIYIDRRQSLTRNAVEKFMEITQSFELSPYLRFRYEKILDINYKYGYAEVYDFGVEDTHTFIANGICSSNCHMLTPPAFNALLKTLEEPPSHAVFVLATTELDKVPATIISRTQHYHFRRPNAAEIAERLTLIAGKEGVGIDQDAAWVIAFAAEGSLRDSESILGQVMAVADKKISRETVEFVLGYPRRAAGKELFALIARKDTAAALALIQELAGSGYDLSYFSKLLMQYFRNALFLKQDPSLKKYIENEMLPDEYECVETHLVSFTSQFLSRGLELIFKNMQSFRRSPIPQLPLELTIIELINTKEA